MRKTLVVIARVVGLVSCAFFGAFAIGEGVPDLVRGADGGLWVTLLLLSAAVGSYFLAWLKPRIGGALLAAAGVALGLHVLLSSGHRDVRFGLVYGVPFTLTGLIFLGAAGPRSS